MADIDYQQMLEDHGYKTAYKNGIAKVWTSDDCYGLGSFDPVTKNRQFHMLAVELAKEGESFSGWSEDIALKVGGKWVLWQGVFDKKRSDNGQ
jgi:hypothetical protein